MNFLRQKIMVVVRMEYYKRWRSALGHDRVGGLYKRMYTFIPETF
jgi:hypothetical protein